MLAADGSFTFSWPASLAPVHLQAERRHQNGSTATVTLTLASNLAPTAIPDRYDLGAPS